MSVRKSALCNLLEDADKKGYLTFQDIIDVSSTFNLSLIEVDELNEALNLRNVIVYDEEPNDNLCNDDLEDYSRTDYTAIFDEIEASDENLVPIIEYARSLPPPQHGETMELTQQMCNGNSFARNRIISLFLRNALKTALSLSKQYGFDLADSISSAVIGLINGIDRFNSNGFSVFHSYVNTSIYQNVMKECQPDWIQYYFPRNLKEIIILIWTEYEKYGMPIKETNEYSSFISDQMKNLKLDKKKTEYYLMLAEKEHEKRIEMNKGILEYENEITPEIYIFNDEYMSEEELNEIELYQLIPEESNAYNPEHCAINSDIKYQLDRILEILEPREKEIIKLRYGLDGNSEHTLENIGEKLDITRERVRQIEGKALRKMRKPSNLKNIVSNDTLEFVKYKKSNAINKKNTVSTVDNCNKDFDVIKILKNFNIQYKDFRSRGGKLWIIGGNELNDIIEWVKPMGYKFHFEKEGAKSTKNRPAWWTK